MLASLGWAMILGEVRGFFMRALSSRWRRFVASGEAIVLVLSGVQLGGRGGCSVWPGTWLFGFMLSPQIQPPPDHPSNHLILRQQFRLHGKRQQQSKQQQCCPAYQIHPTALWQTAMYLIVTTNESPLTAIAVVEASRTRPGSFF
eukprot:scaffold3686_cov193-Alexandrium_tamarense.AAC.9